MGSPSELQSLTDQLLPGLVREIGSTQDEIIRSRKRLQRVPPALLQPPSKAALDQAVANLEKASDQILACLHSLSRQYPGKMEDG